jgi:ATP-dependent Clp protease ATP-binding subunit ClpA
METWEEEPHLVTVLGRALELTLRRAMDCASVRHHQEATVEHLLLALIDDPDAADTLLRCGVDLEDLHAAIAAHLGDQRIPASSQAQPATELQRVVQKAVTHVRELGRPQITGANILVELFSEPDSWAARCLAEQGVGRLQVITAIVEQRDDLKEPS